jgi:PAS domain S-box-containing protein
MEDVLLYEVSKRIGAALNLNDILQITLQEALKATRAKDGSIMTFNPKTHLLEFKAWMVNGEFVRDKTHAEYTVGYGIAGHVASERKAYLCNDTDSDPFFVKSQIARSVGSLLCVPILSKGHVLCIINADSEEKGHFRKEDVNLLSTLADYVAIAIELQTLRDIGLSLSTLPLADLYTQIVENASLLTGAENSVLFVKSGTSDPVERVAAFPFESENIKDKPRDKGLTDTVLQNKELLIINDAQHDERVKQEVKDRGVRALMAAPLNVRLDQAGEGEVQPLGVLFVSTTAERQFSPRDGEILQTLASQAAVAVANARLHDKLNEHIAYQRSLSDNAFDAIVALGNNGSIKEFNKSAAQMLGYSREEALNLHITDLFPERSCVIEIVRLLRGTKMSGPLINHYTIAVGKDLTEVPIRLSVKRLEDGFVGFFREQRDIESVRYHLEQLKALLDTGKAQSQVDDPQSRLEAITGRLHKSLNADAVVLYIYDQGKDEIQKRPLVQSAADNAGSYFTWFASATRALIKHDEYYNTQDASGSSFFGPEFVERTGIRAVAACPLKVLERIVGIVLCGYSEPREFDEELIRSSAYEAAMVINIAQLYADTVRKAEQLHALHMALVGLTSGLSLDDSLQSALERAKDLTHAQMGALGLIDATRALKKFVSTGVDDETRGRLEPPPFEHGLLGQLLAGEEVINIEDMSAPGNTSHFSPHHPTINSFLGVPILSKGRVAGSIYLANKEDGGSFDAEDAVNLRRIASLVSLYVESQRPQNEADTTQALSITFVLLLQWARNVKLRVGEISEELNHFRNALHGSVYQKNISRISKAISSLSSPTHQLEAYTKERSPQPCNFSQLLNKALSELNLSGKPEVQIQRNIIDGYFVKAHQLLLEFAVKIVLENAIDAIEQSGQTGVLTVDCSSDAGRIVTRVTDTGDGIMERIKDQLFKSAVTGKKGEGYASLAAGMILRHYDGDINVERSNQDGTVIKFWLPEAQS